MNLLVVAFLGGIMSAAGSLDMCSRCECKGQFIDCSGGKMKSHANDTVWEGIINVDEVNLDLNSIVHLQAFPPFGTRKLSLRKNLISKIDEAAFRFITNLTELDLGYNLLTTQSLTPHIFRGNYSPEKYEPLKDLMVLRLSGNILHSLRNDLFEHMPNLRIVYLDSNPFKKIDMATSLALSSIYYLQVLDLSSTMLSSFPDNVLHTPKYLKVLNFSSNHFTQIPEALRETHSLEEFIIDDNFISVLRWFPEVPTLKVLKMRWMPSLQSIESLALSNLTRLEELHISHNRHLSVIAEDALMRPPNGEEETSTWPPLKKLDLSHNSLSYLDVGLVARWDRLETVDIQANPWVCDCENQWFLTTLIPHINRTHSSLATEIICYEPPELLNTQLYELSQKKMKMRCLDIYGNQPEKDGRLLISIFICALTLIPIAMAAILILSYRMHRHTHTRYFIPYKNITNVTSTNNI